jgi:hypothetical protein
MVNILVLLLHRCALEMKAGKRYGVTSALKYAFSSFGVIRAVMHCSPFTAHSSIRTVTV